MGNVSADGRQLWLSGRFDDEVYVFDTQTGKVERIPVGLLYRWTVDPGNVAPMAGLERDVGQQAAEAV